MTMLPMKTHASILLVFAAVVTAGGCQRSMVREALPIDGPKADAAASQLDFWHSLPGKGAISNNEGLHGLILFTEGNDPNENYDQRLAFAKQKGWLGEGFDEPGDMVMQRGTLARAIAVSTDIKGGVMMRITNSHGRYASRELQYLGIMAESTPQQALSGLDFVGVIAKVQDYQTIEATRAETGKPKSRIRAVPARDQNSAGVGVAPASGAAPGEQAPDAAASPAETPPAEAPASPAPPAPPAPGDSPESPKPQ